MRFSMKAVSALAFILVTSSIISAQQEQSFSDTCLACLVPAAIVQSPNCNETILAIDKTPNTMNQQELSCFCPLSADPGWLTTCHKSGACTNLENSAGNSQLIMWKIQGCSKFMTNRRLTGSAGTPMASSSPKMIAGAGLVATVVSTVFLF
jgi:hypothetical protein